MNDKEQQIMWTYMTRILSSQKDDRRILALVCSWIWENAEKMSVVIEDDDSYDLLAAYPKAVEKREVTRKMFTETRGLLTHLLDTSKCSKDNQVNCDIWNVEILCECLQIDNIDKEIFSIFYRYETNDTFESLVDDMCKNFLSATDIIVTLTGAERREVVKRLSAEGSLLSMGLLKSKGSNGGYLSNYFSIPDSITRGLQHINFSRDNLKQILIGKPAPGTLEWCDYNHMAKSRDLMSIFLQKALEKQEHGINILLWGTPGTGKTEFCKTLAAELGVEMMSICEMDEQGQEPDRQDRMQALQLAQNLLRDQDNTLLLFDEMDDLLINKESTSIFARPARFSKVFMNRMMENNATPTIWTLNDINLLEESLLRRMSLVVEFEKPPRKNREAILKRILKRQEVELSQSELDSTVDAEVSPAILRNAVRFARIAERGNEGISFALEGISNALGEGAKPPKAGIRDYNPNLVNADLDLEALSEKLLRNETRQFSLCLYGPPGTGKSEYVCYLAEKLGMEPQVVRASDLLDCYVGSSEKNIAKAFRQAQAKGTFLIFDEADSLLTDRQDARQSWQISQVNEMLTWMESHPFPFACTTNLMERVDQASLRRFTFKCRLDYLNTPQQQEAFKHFFNLPLPDDQKFQELLTPGDFATVKRKAKILGELNNSREILRFLSQETFQKNQNNESKKIGFKIC